MCPGKGILLKKMLKKKCKICLESKKNLFLFDFSYIVHKKGFKNNYKLNYLRYEESID